MAFGGSATIVQVNDRTVRITGLTLASALTSGTIGLTGATGTPPDVTLPPNFPAAAFNYNGGAVALADAIGVNINMISAGPLTNLMPSVSKTGTTVADFRITITNTSASLTTQTMEIELTFRGPSVTDPQQLA